MPNENSIVITLPITNDNILLAKGMIHTLMCALPGDNDRRDIMDNFCKGCGSLDRRCMCLKGE